MKQKAITDNIPIASKFVPTNSLPDSKQEFAKAYQFYQNGNHRLAEEICKKLLSVCPTITEALHLLGTIALQIGDHNKSLAFFVQAVEIDPNNPVFHCSHGEVLKELGRLEESITCYHKALALKPDFAEAYYNLGNLYHCRKLYSEAIRCYQKALQLKPDFVEACYNLGNTYLDQKEFKKAISNYHRALVLNPDYGDVHFNLGIALFELEKFNDAIVAYQKTLALKPNRVEAHYNMGIAFQVQRKLKEAITCYQKAVFLKPDFHQACNNLGTAFQDQKKHREAISCFQKAIKLKPDYADACYNLGKSLYDQSRFSDAIACYRKTLQINPDYYKACNNMAKTYQDMREIQKAIFWFQKALQIKPNYAEAHFNLATVYLLTENFQQGWEGYEWRFKRREWKRTYPHRYSKPRWNGESFAGKRLFVHSEQGIGDILQFVRYLPLVKARGGTVIFETTKALMHLFKHLSEIDELVMFSGSGNPSAGFDRYVPLASLPGIFKTTLENIPAEVPYLFADPGKIALWKNRLTTTGLKVGLVWAGTDTDPRRSCPLGWLKSLSDISDLNLYGLQKGAAAEQIEVEGLPEGMRMTNLGQAFEDFTDTAAVIENLDLVISIDTSVAHLSGAMGKPVWVLLPYAADWRWLLNRDDSPWYPTMRLFRQPDPGNWKSVSQQIVTELQEFAAKPKIQYTPSD